MYRVLILLFCCAGISSRAATNGTAATVHPLATDAAIRAMQQGGNAIDGAVAAALTLGVVDGHNSGIGGGCFMLIRQADGAVVAIDGRETAPAKATRNMFVRDGKADPLLSQTGPLAAATPGALAAYDYAIRHFGKLSLSNHLSSAARIAREGFALDRTYAGRLKGTANEIRQYEGTRAVFLKADGSLFTAGEVLKQPDLASSYESIARSGIDWFYRGPFAASVSSWMEGNGGLLRKIDFEKYQPKGRDPIRTTYRGFDVIGFPPPSSGGVHVAQILNILEQFDLREMGLNTANYVHVITEAMKLAFADRAYWLGDPDFAAVPRELVSRTYAKKLARKIRMDHVVNVDAHDTPDRADTDVFGRHTTHFSVADRYGNWVACTATINTSFGSKVMVPGTGIVLNNQMDDFSSQPGVANYFGLVGSDANAVAPGKRPLSSMSPTIILKDGHPLFSVGAAGGPTIISQTVLAIVAAIDFGMSPSDALAQPRFHHQWKPDELRVENRMPSTVRDELTRRGHKVRVSDNIGAAQAIAWSTNQFVAAADPRGEGKAASW